jgi:hypothetical protein
MESPGNEIEAVRLDIETLRLLIDVSLAKGVAVNDPMLRACANVLYERNGRLEALLRNHDKREEAG